MQSGRYSATVLSSTAEVGQLAESALRRLLDSDTILKPRFWLASLGRGSWVPRVVTVRRGNRLVGIVYAKERRIFGVSIGVVFADGTLQNMVVAEPGDQEDVFRVALKQLLNIPGVRGVRLMIPPGGFEQSVVERISSAIGLDVQYFPLENHALVPLAPTYEAYLKSVGYRTRRNFRYYRRQFEAAGNTYVAALSWEEFRDASWKLSVKCSIASAPKAVQRVLDVLSVADEPILVGLRHRDGELMSVAGGWRDDGRVTIFCQWNNDQTFQKESLSVVLRAYLIEMLIQQNMPELRFWAGTSRPLSRYAYALPSMQVYLDVRTRHWRLIRSLITMVGVQMPRRYGADLSWIAPFSPTERAEPETDSSPEKINP